MSQIEDNNEPQTPEPMRIRSSNQPLSNERLIDFDELDNKILKAIIQNEKAWFNFLSAYDKEYIKNKLKHTDGKGHLENPGAFYPSLGLLNEIKAAEIDIRESPRVTPGLNKSRYRNTYVSQITDERQIDFDELDIRVLETIKTNNKGWIHFFSDYDRAYIRYKLANIEPNPLGKVEPFYPSVQLLNEIKAVESEIAAESDITAGGKRTKYRKSRKPRRKTRRKTRRKPRRKTRRHR